MTEEKKIIEELKNEPISVVTRNLRLVKRLILGKNKPPLFLRILCWGSLGWSTLMTLYFGVITLLIYTSAMPDKDISLIGGRYFMVYTCLHILAIIGVILMWRLKKIGFYIYSIATLTMPFLLAFMSWQTYQDSLNKIEPIVLLFSVITIALFALNWKSLKLINKKEEEIE